MIHKHLTSPNKLSLTKPTNNSQSPRRFSNVTNETHLPKKEPISNTQPQARF